MSKRNVLVEIIGSLLILLFVYTAINKLLDISNFTSTMSKSPLIGSSASFLAIAVPVGELMIAALLFIPRTRLAGLYGSLGLMTAFTLYIGYMLSFAEKLPCSCGGVISKMTWNQHLVFNIFFTLLSLLGVVLERRRRKQKKDPELPPVVFT
jgi:putative oxidoreductase